MGCDEPAQANLSFEGNISKDAKDLIRRLLNRDSRGRLGCGKAGIKEIFKHPWFSKVNWSELEKGNAPVPFVPEVRDETDVSNFDEVAPEDMHTEHSDPCHDRSLCVPAPLSLACLRRVRWPMHDSYYRCEWHPQ